jgi:hypothetical protein
MNSFDFGDSSSSTPPSMFPRDYLYNFGDGEPPNSNGNVCNYENSGDSCDSFVSSVSVMTDDTNHHPGLIYTYDVRFKTCTEQYLFHEKLMIGEIVTVQCERGYNIGYVDGEALPDPDNPPQKRILAKLVDEDDTIKDLLKLKIVDEKNALAQCRLDCQGHRLASFADSIAAEFQFDRKKLTIYLKKYEDVSVCRLVRKLYDHYQIRIKVLEVDDPETMKDLTKKYLELSNLQVPLSDAFNFDPATSVLCAKNQRRLNNHSPNYSKFHLGQAKHLVPSLAQYGPHANKQRKQSLSPAAAITITTSVVGQPQWSDRLSYSEYRQPQPQQQFPQAHKDYQHQHQHQTSYSQLYQQSSRHHVPLAPTLSPGLHMNQNHHHYPSQPHSSWTSSNGNHRGDWGGIDQPNRQLQRFDKPPMHTHNRHDNLHYEDCSDEVLYHRCPCDDSNQYPPPLAPPLSAPPCQDNSIFGEQEDSMYSFASPHLAIDDSCRVSETSTSSFDLGGLSAALSCAPYSLATPF